MSHVSADAQAYSQVVMLGPQIFDSETSGTLSKGDHLKPIARTRILTKRVLDLGLSVSVLLISAPILVAIAALVAADGGPIFFSHKRIGRGGKVFGCLKFRTMVIDSDRRLTELLETDPSARQEWLETRKLRHDPRVTAVGRLLRNFSLDELPQLLNVVFGDMSLVGPRPVTKEELRDYYGDVAISYCVVRPGVTGAWQVSGRSSTTFVQRVRLDEDYVHNLSLRTDIKILAKTVRVVLQREGAC